MMALLFESVALLVELASKPILLVALFCQFCLRSMSVVVQTWIELMKVALYLHFNLLWRPAIWSIAVLSLPVRALCALRRERTLLRQLLQLRTELEAVLWVRKELEKQLRIAIKERRVIEAMLMKLEDEYDEAVEKSKLFEKKVYDLKNEIMRIKEVECKSGCDVKRPDYTHRGNSTLTTLSSPCHCHKSTSNLNISPDDAREHDINDGTNTISEDASQMEAALSHTLFSAILSLVVGMIIREAEDPCVPLVVALFTVVIISLSSVLKFFATVQHRPDSQAVALLSLNWFILGALTYPTLPMLASASSLLASTALELVFKLSAS